MKQILVLIVFIMTPFQMVYAGCSDLATTFSNNPDSMDIDDLASLKKCVTSKLRQKFSSEDPVPRYAPMPMYAPMPQYAPAPEPAPPLMPAPSR